MVVSVTFNQSVGGDGSSYNDGIGVGGMAEGGNLLYFFPLLQQYLNVAAFIANAASSAASSAASAANAPGTNATTSTSITPGAGSKSLTLAQTGKAYSVTQSVNVGSAANPANFIAGPITAFTSGSGAMTINATAFGGSPFSDGVVTLSAVAGVLPTRAINTSGLATGGGNLSADRIISVLAALQSDILIGTDTSRAVTINALYSALPEVPLQFGALITTVGDNFLDMSKFVNGSITMQGNAQLPTPLNPKPGQSGRIRFIQDAAGGRSITWGPVYKCDGGLPVLSTQPGAVDYLYYDVVNSGEVMCSFAKAPKN